MTIRPVQYAKALSGELIAVEAGPHHGFEFMGKVYPTEPEARKAKGESDKRIYIESHTSEAEDMLRLMIESASPFAEWREQYDDNERVNDLASELIDDLFPAYRNNRSDYARRFIEAIMLAYETEISL